MNLESEIYEQHRICPAELDAQTSDVLRYRWIT